MKGKNYILLLFLLLLHFTVSSQVTIERSVLGSNGASVVMPWGTIDYTVGECMVTTTPTTNSVILTQGFQQPDTLSRDGFVDMDYIPSPCIGANNGTAIFTFSTDTADYPVIFTFNNGIPDTIKGPPNPNPFIVYNLSPATYSYTVKYNNNLQTDTIPITEVQVPCLTFYSGITPNNDANNDTWIIDGINYYKNNNVTIFNRWGDIVWSKNNYDNTNTVWNGKSNTGADLPDATYFFVVEIDGKVCEECKGWVELTH